MQVVHKGHKTNRKPVSEQLYLTFSNAKKGHRMVIKHRFYVQTVTVPEGELGMLTKMTKTFKKMVSKTHFSKQM